MNLNKLIRMAMRLGGRKLLNQGINRAVGTKPKEEMTPQERKQARAARQSAKRARQASKMARRLR
ncbi:MAG: hypothetical protein AAFN59_12470 [Pseudomonadota bacterium]